MAVDRLTLEDKFYREIYGQNFKRDSPTAEQCAKVLVAIALGEEDLADPIDEEKSPQEFTFYINVSWDSYRTIRGDDLADAGAILDDMLDADPEQFCDLLADVSCEVVNG